MVSPGKLFTKLKDLLFKVQYNLFVKIYGSKPISLETIEMGLYIFQPKRVKGYDAIGSKHEVLVFLPSLIDTVQWAKLLANNLEKDEKINALFYNCKPETYFVFDWVNTIEGHSKQDYLDILVELKTHLQRVVVFLKGEARKSTAAQINRRVIQAQLTNIAVLIDSLNQCSL
jgi:hypothetical protein